MLKNIEQVIENNLVVDCRIGRLITFEPYMEPSWNMSIRKNIFAVDGVDTRYGQINEYTLKGKSYLDVIVPPGATGVAAGTQGSLDGLQLSRGPAHVLRSVVEGLAFELSRHLELLRDGGLAAQRLLMTASMPCSATWDCTRCMCPSAPAGSRVTSALSSRTS